MPLETEPYDTVDYLADQKDIVCYLKVASEDLDTEHIAAALDKVVRAYGFARLSQETGIPYCEAIRALNIDNRNNLDGLLKIIDALGVKSPAKRAA
jgi:probable addiction module antidote protein